MGDLPWPCSLPLQCLVPLCASCLTPTKCDVCYSFTYKDAKTGQCRQCPRGCSDCNARRCFSADEGYVLVGGQPKK